MKNNIVFGIFAAIFALFCGIIYLNLHKLDINIFSILGLNLSKEELSVLDAQSSDKISILLQSPSQKSEILEIAKNSGVEIAQSDFNLDKSLILPFANSQKVATLKEKPAEFLNLVFKEKFMLPNISGDFFNLLDFSTLIQGFEVQNGLIKTQNFYLLDVKIKGGVSEILDFGENINKAGFVISGTPLFAAFGAKTAMSESNIFGLISLFLCVIFILFVFRSFRALNVALIVVFSLFGGLAMAILVLDSLHLLVVVICTSLIGLILDYPLHILSVGKNAPKNTILVAFGVSFLGYFLFLFSPMEFLKQIAIFSMFALFFAIVASKILFVRLMGDFTPKCDFFDFKIPIKLRYFCLFLLFIIAIFGFGLYKIRDENIANYATAPKWLVQDSKILGQEMQYEKFAKFAIVPNARQFADEFDLSDSIFWAKFIHSKQEQEEIQNAFRKILDDKDLLVSGQKFGISKELLTSQINEILNLQTISPLQSCEMLLKEDCARFFTSQGEVIYAQDFKNAKANIIDIKAKINEKFDEIKINAIYLKIIGLCVAIFILWLVLGVKDTLKSAFIVFVSVGVSLFLLVLFDKEAGIFSIFGLVLASLIACEYGIFAFTKAKFSHKITGIMTASITTFISFGALVFSTAPAVAGFGFASAFGILIASILAVLLAS